MVARLTLLACMATVLFVDVLFADESATIVVKVNGSAITTADVNFAASQQGKSAEEHNLIPDCLND